MVTRRVSTYLKHVGKSFGYAVTDVMKEYNPVVTSLIKDTKETTEDLYESIKPYVSSKEDINEKSLAGSIRNTIDDSIKNLFDDLKSGNLYNKSRQKAADDALAKSIMGDFDLDFDFDEDWGDFDDEDDSSAKAIVANNDNSTKEIIGAVDQVGYKVADVLGTTTIESADYIVRSSNRGNKALYALNRRGFSQVTEALLSVNNSIASFAKIGEPLSAHMQNSSVFFTKTTETLNRMDQTLQQIAKNTTPAPSATNGNYNLAKGTLGDFLGDEFNLSSYTGMIKENFEEYKDMLSMITDTMKGMKDDSTGSYGKNISLASMGTKFLVKQMIPNMLKDSMKDFNEGLKNFIGAGLVKARNTSSGNLVVDLLKDMFLPKDGYKKNINTGNYNKGQVAWDGIARKALTEVIPEYLSGIYRSLSGKDLVYDYNKGKFITRKSIKDDIESENRYTAKKAGGDFRKDALKSIDNNEQYSAEYKAQMKKEIEEYFYNAFSKGDDFWDIKNFSERQMDQFGLSNDSRDALVNILNKYDRTPKKKSNANKFVTDVQMARDSAGNNKRREEATGTSREVYLQNGFDSGLVNNGREGLTDEFNHSSLFYLAGIYENTGYLADNIGYIGGKSSKIKRKRRLKKSNEVESIAKPTEDNHNSSVGGERTIRDTIFSAGSGRSVQEIIDEYNDASESDEEALLDELYSRMDPDEVERIKDDKRQQKLKKGWKGKMQKALNKFTPKFLRGKFDKPFESAANILDKINVAMTQVIWGKDQDPNGEDGFLGYLMKSTKEAFQKFSDNIDEMFPDLKKKISGFWDMMFGAKGEDGKRHGGKLGEFRDQTREELKNTATWMGQSVKNFFGSGKKKKKKGRSLNEQTNDALREANGVDNAAYGRQVTKSGIVAVSQGEMIVPSEFNPFYNGVTNKRDQIQKEKGAISKFYGMFNKGTTNVGDKDSDKKGFFEGVADKIAEKVNESRNTKREKDANGNEKEGAGHKFIRQGFETLGSGFAEFFQRIGGNNDQEEIEKEKKSFNKKASDLLKEAGLNKGAIGAGALIGGGVSLLTGAVVGPLFGAAIGGAVGLALKSEQAQKILFGDDKGNKGLLPKQVGDFIKNQLPDVGAGTAIGAAGGLFMGSPVLGAVLGGTIGYVKSSEKAQKFLFGEKDKDGSRKGGLISKTLQEKIKKAVPGISAGMIAGAVVGPFGIVGNLMVGAGLGYLATSNNFHKWMFGENGQGGFVETFKNKIFDNLDIISRNMWNAFKARTRNLFKSLGEKVQDILTKKAKAARDGEGGGLIGKALNFGNKVIMGTTNKVGNFLDRRRSKIVGRNLAKGYEVYDYVEDENGKRVKKTLNAAERIARRGESNNSSINNFDKMIADANSKEELIALQKQLADLRNPKRAQNRARNDALTGLYSGLSDLDRKDASKIGKLVSKGKYNDALQMIESMGLSSENASRYKDAINNAKSGLENAADVRGAKNQIIQSFRDKGIDVTKAGKLENMQDYINEEIKQRFSDEQVADKEEKDYKSKVTEFLDSIRENTEIIASGKVKKSDDSESAKDVVDKSRDEEVMDILREANGVGVNKSNNTAAEKIKDSQPNYTTTAFGDTIKMTTNSQGESVPDIRDSGTKESMETSGEIKKSIKSIPLIGSAVIGMQGFFGSIKDKIFGSEQKPGLLGTIKNLLSGEAGGPLSYLFNFLAGSKLGTIGKGLKSLASKITLKGVLADVAAPALFGLAFTGAFDNIFAKFGWGKSNKDSDVIYDKNTGEQYTKDKNGNLIDSNGNIVDQSVTSIGIRSGDTKSFSDSLKVNTVRGALTGTKSVASVVLGKTTVGKGIKGIVKNASTAITSADSVAALAAKNNLVDTVIDGCTKLTGVLRKVPALSGIADKLDDMGLALADKVSEKIASESAKNIASMAANAVLFARIALIGWDFSTGYEDARSTLGITSKPSIGQKIISGLLRATKNFIPIIGTLIPDNVLVDLFCKFVAPALGIDSSELMKQREESQKEVDKYNAEHGTNYDVQQYNKTVLKDYTWTERIGNAAKSTVNDAKNKWSNFKTSVKEKGLGGTIKNSFKNDVDLFKESYTENGGGVFGAINALGDTLGSKLPGVFGEIVKKNAQIKAYATKGDLSSLWKVSLDDFSSDTSKGEAEVGVFSKVIGQIPLIFTKVSSTPIALVSKAGQAIGDLFKPVIESAKYLASLPGTVYRDTENMMYDSKSELKDFLDISKYQKEDSSSIFNGMISSVAGTSRILSLPVLLVKSVGRKIGDALSGPIESAKTGISNLNAGFKDIRSKVKDGDVSGLLNASIEDNVNSPVGGFTKGIFTISKWMHLPTAGLSWVGHKIGDGISSIVDRSKTNYSTMKTSIDALKDFAKDGDVKSVLKEKIKLEKFDPLSNIWKAMFNISKIFQLISAALHKIGGPIIDGVKDLKDKASDVIDGAKEKVGETVDNVKTTASNAVSTVKNGAYNLGNSAFQAVKGFISGGGSGTDDTFVSQYDEKYKDMSYAGSTVSEKGCAPAVAAMVAKKYGKKYDMNQAINDSTKFQNDEGTSADYFKTVLGNQGIATQYLQGPNSVQQVTQALANGEQVILLGKDPNNTSKDSSPFGPNGHYVVATGLDKNGNLIINDPESDAPKTYSSNILKSINMGITTSSSGSGGNYDTDTARKVWGYFTSNGYSPAATAGIMGNLYQESGMDPTRHQTNGPAAGIAQWEKFGNSNSRWGKMQDFANKKGYNWSDLDPQLQFLDHETSNDLGPYWKKTDFSDANAFKSATDPMKATLGFEKAFERAGKPMMENRYKAAEEYYKLYQDSGYTGVYSADGPSGEVSSASGDSTSSTESSDSSSTKGLGILAAITSAFSRIGNLFTGSSDSDSTTATTSTDGSSTSGSSDGSVQLGDVPTGKGNSAQKKIVQYAESILGKDQYSQDSKLRTKVGQGYSDCSSFAQWAYKNAIGVDPGSNTGAIIDSPLLTTVDEGSAPNVDKLEAGDLMLFKSASPNGRTKNVGHVEIYDGNGNVIGHGSGVGPKVHTLQDYLSIRNKMGAPYIETRRYSEIASLGGSNNNSDSVTKTNGSTLSAAGSGLSKSGSSSILLSRKPSFRNKNRLTKSELRSQGIKSNSRFNISSGSGTDISDNNMSSQSTQILNNMKSSIQNSSSISADLVQKLLEAITNVLNSIANNTAPIEKIYEVLTNNMGVNTSNTNNSNNNSVSIDNNSNTSSTEVSDNISNLVGVLGEIARG